MESICFSIVYRHETLTMYSHCVVQRNLFLLSQILVIIIRHIQGCSAAGCLFYRERYKKAIQLSPWKKELIPSTQQQRYCIIKNLNKWERKFKYLCALRNLLKIKIELLKLKGVQFLLITHVPLHFSVPISSHQTKIIKFGLKHFCTNDQSGQTDRFTMNFAFSQHSHSKLIIFPTFPWAIVLAAVCRILIKVMYSFYLGQCIFVKNTLNRCWCWRPPLESPPWMNPFANVRSETENKEYTIAMWIAVILVPSLEHSVCLEKQLLIWHQAISFVFSLVLRIVSRYLCFISNAIEPISSDNYQLASGKGTIRSQMACSVLAEQAYRRRIMSS